jgi:hypothetical protein
MKFAWVLIFLTTIASASEPDEDNPLYGNNGSIVRNNSSDQMQLNFFDHLVDYTGKAFHTGITCIPHAFRLTLGISSLFSENRDLTYALMRASGVAWALYYLKIGMSNDYVHNDEDGPPFMQSVYRTSFIYSGLSYFTYFPYFTHFGALHITHDICLYGYKILTKPKETKKEQ